MLVVWMLALAAAAADTHGGISGTGLTVRLDDCESWSSPGDSTVCIVAWKVTGGSAAAVAGLHKGDPILALRPHQLLQGYQAEREYDATTDELALVESLLAGPPGTSAEIVFLHDAEEKTAWLERGDSHDTPWCTQGDCQDGRGTVVIWDMSWKGYFQAGRPVGAMQVLIWGGTYDGEVNRSWVPEGEGSFRDAEGDVWTGTWTAEAWTGPWQPAQGRGTRLEANGDKYTGQWSNLQREGMGREVRTDKTGWDGAWHEDEPVGKGTWVGADPAGRKGTYVGTVTAMTDAGAPIFDGPVTRNFGLAGGAEYYSGCGRCLTASKKTQLTGMWNETGLWQDGLPVGLHEFHGPSGSLETWDYGHPAPQ